jgi:hypothetical protein
VGISATSTRPQLVVRIPAFEYSEQLTKVKDPIGRYAASLLTTAQKGEIRATTYSYGTRDDNLTLVAAHVPLEVLSIHCTDEAWAKFKETPWVLDGSVTVLDDISSWAELPKDAVLLGDAVPGAGSGPRTPRGTYTANEYAQHGKKYVCLKEKLTDTDAVHSQNWTPVKRTDLEPGLQILLLPHVNFRVVTPGNVLATGKLDTGSTYNDRTHLVAQLIEELKKSEFLDKDVRILGVKHSEWPACLQRLKDSGFKALMFWQWLEAAIAGKYTSGDWTTRQVWNCANRFRLTRDPGVKVFADSPIPAVIPQGLLRRIMTAWRDGNRVPAKLADREVIESLLRFSDNTRPDDKWGRCQGPSLLCMTTNTAAPVLQAGMPDTTVCWNLQKRPWIPSRGEGDRSDIMEDWLALCAEYPLMGALLNDADEVQRPALPESGWTHDAQERWKKAVPKDLRKWLMEPNEPTHNAAKDPWQRFIGLLAYDARLRACFADRVQETKEQTAGVKA